MTIPSQVLIKVGQTCNNQTVLQGEDYQNADEGNEHVATASHNTCNTVAAIDSSMVVSDRNAAADFIRAANSKPAKATRTSQRTKMNICTAWILMPQM